MGPTDLGTVLRPLAGTGLYLNNAFRLTGLPVCATTRLIRRRRTEAERAARVPGAEDERDIAPEDLSAVFESLGDPLVRLTHEVLWLWQADDAVPAELTALSSPGADLRLHREAMEAELDQGMTEEIDADRLEEMWRRGLAAWAEVLSSERLWSWVTRRAHGIGDPRLTRGVVRRIRKSLPAHIVAVHAALTAWAVESGDQDADRFVRWVHESPFDDGTVDRGLHTVINELRRRLPEARAEGAAGLFAVVRLHGRGRRSGAGPLRRFVDRLREEQ